MSGRKVIPIAASAPRAAPGDEDGWRVLSTLSEPRLSEMARNYRALGYEVQIRDVQRVDDPGACTACFDAGGAAAVTYGTLYVRRAPGQDPAAAHEDGLFD